MLSIRDVIQGKICFGCDRWKPLSEFPSDRTKGNLKGSVTAIVTSVTERTPPEEEDLAQQSGQQSKNLAGNSAVQS